MTDKIKLTTEQMVAEGLVVQEQFSASLNFDELYDEKHVYTLSDSGIRVLHFPELLHAHAGSVLAGYMKMIDSSCTDVEDFIVVDDYFMDLPEDIQKWLIYHELGHIHHKHLDNPKKACRRMAIRSILNKVGLTTRAEIEADHYATNHTSVDTTLRSLSYMQEIFDIPGIYKECAIRKLFVKLFGKGITKNNVRLA